MVCNCQSRLLKLVALLILPCFGLKAQNLLINPGAEDGPPATNGWTVVNSGSDCYSGGGWRIEGNQNGFPAAHSGTHYFYPGCGGMGWGKTYELYQDVDVSASAAVIDIKGYGVTFSGYTRSVNELLFPDGATITVEARNAANTKVIGSYSTGQTHNSSGWKYYTATAILPPGTRFIRVRLIANFNNWTSIDSYFDDLSLKSLSVTPVNLFQFKAVTDGEDVLLNWQTANELNGKGFTIMRSSDQSNWNDLAFIKSNYEKALTNNYSFEDENPLDGRNFYKLRQTDIDGTVKYSRIRTVVMDEPSWLQVYPNPAHGILNIQISDAPSSLEIMDIYGRSIMRYSDVKKIDISKLPDGVYILKAITGDKVLATKFIKR